MQHCRQESISKAIPRGIPRHTVQINITGTRIAVNNPTVKIVKKACHKFMSMQKKHGVKKGGMQQSKDPGQMAAMVRGKHIF